MTAEERQFLVKLGELMNAAPQMPVAIVVDPGLEEGKIWAHCACCDSCLMRLCQEGTTIGMTRIGQVAKPYRGAEKRARRRFDDNAFWQRQREARAMIATLDIRILRRREITFEELEELLEEDEALEDQAEARNTT